jgi:hypothetical protein
LQLDVEQPVVEECALDLDALGQHEGALELPRRDAAMEEDAPSLSSRWRPRMTSCSPSWVIASSSIEKPATARVMRSRASDTCSML